MSTYNIQDTDMLSPDDNVATEVISNNGMNPNAITTLLNSSSTIIQRIRAQRSIENDLVQKYTCSALNPDIVKEAKYRIFNIDDLILGNIMNTAEGLNSQLHSNLSCAVDAIISSDESGLFVPTTRENVRNWFRDTKLIGGESVEGYALGSSFSKNSHLFVLKTPRRLSLDELLHETFIGLYALNNVRRYVPNFMYVYGYVKCSSTVIANKETITWCSSDEPAVTYMIAENIQNSIPLKKFLLNDNITERDLLNIMLQVFNALAVANNIYGYTHYDLHTDNILIKKLDKPVAIPFYNEQGGIISYIVSEYIPYIIDYGYSAINYNGIGFGKIGMEQWNITAKSYPMFDVYKILGFMGHGLGSNAKLLEVVNKLFGFFNEGSISDRVRRKLLDKTDYYRPNITFADVTHYNYLDWLLNRSGISLPLYPSVPSTVQLAPINKHMTTYDFYSLVFTDNRELNALEYCNLIRAIYTADNIPIEQKLELIQMTNQKFSAIDDINKTYPGILTRLNGLKDINYDIPDATFVNIFDMDYIQQYKKRIYELLEAKDIASEISSYIKSNLCALETQRMATEEIKYQLGSHAKELAKIDGKLKNSKSLLERNNRYALETISRVPVLPEYQQQVLYWKREDAWLIGAL